MAPNRISGLDRQASSKVIARIVSDLPRATSFVGHSVKSDDFDLTTGVSGVVLLFSELVRRGRADLRSELSDLTEFIIEEGSGEFLSLGFYVGLSGVGYALERAVQVLGNQWGDPNEELDEAIADGISNADQDISCDLINGLSGIGMYALSRLPRASAVHTLGYILTHLEARSIGVEHGITISTIPQIPHLKATPNRIGQLGVAHGQAGVTGFLAHLSHSAYGNAAAERMLTGVTDWLIAEKQQWRENAHEMSSDSPSWCWGDLGIASVILSAAAARDNSRWKRAGVQCARDALRQFSSDFVFRDACVCHGAAGAAYLFRTLYRHTGDNALSVAATRCISQVMNMSEEQGLGGFRFILDRPDGSLDWGESPGFLWGSSGVAMVLLDAEERGATALDHLLLT